MSQSLTVRNSEASVASRSIVTPLWTQYKINLIKLLIKCFLLTFVRIIFPLCLWKTGKKSEILCKSAQPEHKIKHNIKAPFGNILRCEISNSEWSSCCFQDYSVTRDAGNRTVQQVNTTTEHRTQPSHLYCDRA